MIMTRKRSVYNTLPSVRPHDYNYNKSYHDITDFAKRFIAQTVKNVMQIIITMDDKSEVDEKTRVNITRSLSYFGTEWPTCGSINVRNGQSCIETEMVTWNTLPVARGMEEWVFHVDFIGLEKERNTEFYNYQVLWSVPTRSYPEPQVTVSVFFCIAASQIQPPHFPVDVTYVFEAYQFVHRLNMIFRPKWLHDIFDMKTMMFQSFTF